MKSNSNQNFEVNKEQQTLYKLQVDSNIKNSEAM